MKKIIFSALMLVSFTAGAQSTYEAVRLFDNDLTGTARYVSMGGAMNALGADLTLMSTNPAGTAVYKASDIAITGLLDINSMTSNSYFESIKNKKTTGAINQVGAVFVLPTQNNSSFNIGINYKHRNGFNRDLEIIGDTWGDSQMFIMQDMYDLGTFDPANITYQDYLYLDQPWLGLLGVDGGLLDEEGYRNYVPTNYVYHSEEEGGVDDIDINLSANLNDRIYLGVTVGAHYVDYNRYSYYGEDDEFGQIYTLYNWYATRGNGIDLKLGAIIRPFEYSPFKIGVAVHTPTWYRLTDRTSACIEGQPSPISAPDGYMDTQSMDAYGSDYYLDYELSTPWRVNVAASYTFGSVLALDAEYEYSDYSTATMKYDDGHKIEGMKDEFESNLKGVNTFRVGAELNLSPSFSLRAGYNYSSAPFNKNATKYMLSYTNTNTEYMNSFESNVITAGLGYRSSNFYLDLAYMYTTQDSDFGVYDGSTMLSKIGNERHQLMCTLGFRLF